MEASQAERHISGVYTKLLMEFLVGTMPPDRIDTLLAQAAESRSLAELADAGSWSSYDQFRRLLEERSRLDPTSLYDQSELLSDWLKTWELSQAAQTLDSPGTLLASGSEENPLVPIRRYEKTEVASNEWTIRESFKDDYQPYPEFCDFAAVQYAIIPIVFGLPTGEVVEEECQCRGDAACVFRLRWQDEDTDSLRADHYRMRAELVEDRLEQIQEMIADLTSSERYEDVLQGFVASSLRTAVGSGGALLALEPRAGRPRQVYFEGLNEAEAMSMADDLLAGRAGPGNVVAVDVASARRRHGVLAVDEGGGVFSSLSESTLQSYARLAASALDTADALDEARQQANTAQALLDLAMSLTEIVCAEDMASKVAAAVPDIIDCDRAAVFLDQVDELGVSSVGHRLAGSIGYCDEDVARLSSRSFRQAPPDSVVAGGLTQVPVSEFGTVASVSAPIVVAGETIGAIVAGVTSRPERLTVTPWLSERLNGLAAQASTAIANARLVDQIRFQAVHDSLTGLPNRALILDRTELMLARARRDRIQIAALFIDLDGFKDVNDALGHGVGDQLLRAVTERLQVTMRETDSIGRLGGDEFVVLVDGSSMDVGPELVAERLLEVLRPPFLLPGVSAGPLTVTASIGIATGIRASATELLRDADIALYEAKAHGKDCFVAFEPEMHTVVQDQHLLEMDLREALRDDQFSLVFQPIFNLSGGETTGVEALLRWDHPRRGTLPPEVFVPTLESSGMMAAVGRWVLHEACRQGARWQERGYRLGVSVNVSPRQLNSDHLIDDVRDALAASGFTASSLTIEISEKSIMRIAMAPRLEALKATGIRIAVDDFGTGLSALTYLRQFPVDIVKIDRSFIASLADSPESGTLLRTLVELGKTLGLETLAEGIEESGQYSQLEREHCDSGQGFLYARPLEVDAVESFLAGRPLEGSPSSPGTLPIR